LTFSFRYSSEEAYATLTEPVGLVVFPELLGELLPQAATESARAVIPRKAPSRTPCFAVRTAIFEE
jgi:hypothetical protein